MCVIALEWIGILAVAACAFLAIWLSTVTEPQLTQVSDAVWARYEGDGQTSNGDRAVVYIHREADRQINKVRGLLTFDGILFVVARAYTSEPDVVSALFGRAALTYISISIIVSLVLFRVNWGDISAYREFKTEFLFAMREVRNRTLFVNYAVVLSLLSAVAVSISMFLHTLT
jgi:hypothetical protein